MNITKLIKQFNLYFIKSISFYPAVMSLLFIFISILMLHFERHGLSRDLHKVLENIIITHNETARTTLSSIITGMISITVFSFTMVMVVLSQTGTNYSPRLIPGLITYRSNQIVLGFYLGTIIYSLIILINVQSEDLKFNVPGASILLDVIFSIISLGMFVYFIHSISQSIQIGNVMENVFNQSLTTIRKTSKESRDKKSKTEPDIKNWFSIDSLESGFLQDFNEDLVCSVAEKHDLIVKFMEPPGFYINKGLPFIQVNKNISEKEGVSREILKGFTFKEQEIIGINYLFGFKHLSEIAVKALSPGINDPGTASRVLDYLAELFAERMMMPTVKVIEDKSGNPRVIINRQSVSEMFSAYLSPIRNYGRQDLTVTKKLLEVMHNLILLSKSKQFENDEIYFFILSVIEDADRNIFNKLDRQILNSRIKNINSGNFFPNKFAYLTD